MMVVMTTGLESMAAFAAAGPGLGDAGLCQEQQRHCGYSNRKVFHKIIIQ
jgi:hypothetical protein